MTKYCPVCGYPNPDDAMFCAKCGYKFPQPSQQASQPYTPAQPMPSQPPAQPNYYPPPPPQGPSPMDKVIDINRRLLMPFAGLLTGLEMVLLAIGFILLFGAPFTAPGGAEPFGGALGTFIGAFAIYVIIGLLVLVLGIKRGFSGYLPFMLGFMTFLYFLILAVAVFLVYHQVKLGSLASNGTELVIGSVFLLIALLIGRPNTAAVQYYQQGPYPQYPSQGGGLPIDKIIAYVFGLIATILIYVGLDGFKKGIELMYGISTSQLPVSDVVGASFFGSGLAVVAGILASIGLMALALLNRSEVGRRATYMLLELALLIFSVGQIMTGAGAIGNGLPDTTGKPGVLAGSLYTLYAGGIIDLIAGILVLLLSILLMVEEAFKIIKAVSTYPGYRQPPPGGMPPST